MICRGLGKTYTGSEKLNQLHERVNLVVCQKSKVNDWLLHFDTYYPDITAWDLTDKHDYNNFFKAIARTNINVGVINYDLIYRRPDFLKLEDFTLMLDESSVIQNEQTRRAKYIMKLHYNNLILLSGTPTSGKYERLFSQLSMLGYGISKDAFLRMYVDSHLEEIGGHYVPIIDGYKNVERLKSKMRALGCDFLKTSEVIKLPEQTFIPVIVPVSKDYKKFRKTKIVEVEGVKLKGDTILTEILYLRMLCGAYSEHKLQAFNDLLNSTGDGLIVFYNFNNELEKLRAICEENERPVSIINGSEKNLDNYNRHDNAVVLVNYQAGAMGLNLQKYNKIIYFTPNFSSELYQQSTKRIHRIGQSQPCFYYNMICADSIEKDIYATLEKRKNYTDELFKQKYTQ